MQVRAFALSLLLCAAPALAQKEKAAPVPTEQSVPQIVGRVQKLYEGTADLHARFTQSLQGVMGKRQASGEVWLKKPGKMRWDYEKPDKKLFVADGTQLWVYEPEDEQVFRQSLGSSQLPAQVSFLFGKGRLLNDFDISLMTDREARSAAVTDREARSAAVIDQGLGVAGDILLKLVPKVATTQYRYLAFVVDPKSFLVKETVVYDQQGGQNHLTFGNIEMNLKGGIDDGRFRFTPPTGTKVINAGK